MSSSMRAALAALSLSRDPLADIARTAPKFDAVGLGACQQLQSIPVDQLEVLKDVAQAALALPRGHFRVESANLSGDRIKAAHIVLD